MWRRTSSESLNTSKPAMRAVPDVAGMNPVRIRIVVVLPAPFGPRKPRISPLFTVNEIWSTAVTEPYAFVRSCTSINTFLRVRGNSRPWGVCRADIYTRNRRDLKSGGSRGNTKTWNRLSMRGCGSEVATEPSQPDPSRGREAELGRERQATTGGILASTCLKAGSTGAVRVAAAMTRSRITRSDEPHRGESVSGNMI